MTQKSNLVAHAEKELDILLGDNAVTLDGMDALTRKSVLDIVKLFSRQGHSGGSAAYVTGMVEKLLRFEPITPLTGEPDEWTEVQRDNKVVMYQNKRCSHVFKEVDYENSLQYDGIVNVYDIEGKVFVDKDGSTWTNFKSRTPVTFPYTPTRKYVQRRWWKFWL